MELEKNQRSSRVTVLDVWRKAERMFGTTKMVVMVPGYYVKPFNFKGFAFDGGSGSGRKTQ